MSWRNASIATEWDDDDLPEWTEEQFARAQLSVGGVVIQPATGTLTRAGRPPTGEEPSAK